MHRFLFPITFGIYSIKKLLSLGFLQNGKFVWTTSWLCFKYWHRLFIENFSLFIFEKKHAFLIFIFFRKPTMNINRIGICLRINWSNKMQVFTNNFGVVVVVFLFTNNILVLQVLQELSVTYTTESENNCKIRYGF